MPYLCDERDIHFNIFEYLPVESLLARPEYTDQSVDMYKMVLTEGLKFCLKELDPLSVSGDRAGCQIKNGKVLMPEGYKEAFSRFAQNGFLSIDVPLTHGGQGLPKWLNIALFEFYSGTNIAMTLFTELTRGGGFLIESFAKKELADLFCKKMYQGTWTGTMCLTEPQAGSAVGDLKTSAKLNRDGTYSISGRKIFISCGDHDMTENIIHLVLARVEGDAPGTKGISLFIVPKIWVNEDGSLGELNDVSVVGIEHKMGIKASPTCALNFGEKGRCRGYLVGEQSQGMRYMFFLMNDARLFCGMQGLALAGTAYANALKYAKERVQGGNTAIINYPDVRRNLAFCRSWVEGMRGLIYRCGFFLDQVHTHPDKSEKQRYQNLCDLLTPVCKAYCSDFGFKVTELALQIYGGYGYISDYPVEQYLRDVKIASIYEGTNGIQAIDLVMRKLLRDEGRLFKEYYKELLSFVEKYRNHDALKSSVTLFEQALAKIINVVKVFSEWIQKLVPGGDKNEEKILLSATAFLEMLGHIAVAHVLLEQAVIACEKISSNYHDVFYQDKLHTTKFFISHVLPQVFVQEQIILNEDSSAMQMKF